MEFSTREDFCVSASYVPAVTITALFPSDLNQVLTFTDATYRIFVSTEYTYPSLFTRYKTTNRGSYDKQRAILPALSCSSKEAGLTYEMLLFNSGKGEIMEGTITTPYFYRNGGWITPSEACGGHLGVTRRWALGSQLVTEGVVLAKEVEIGETVILSNGVRGFGWGKVENLELELRDAELVMQ